MGVSMVFQRVFQTCSSGISRVFQDDSRFKFQFGNEEKPPEYNYNWPYDFFSLVELVKMESKIEFTPLAPPVPIMEQIAAQQETAQAAPGAGAGAIPEGGFFGGGG